ncbi:MAG TPA: HNH endonuclease [Bacteroidia bacterium]|nr:HNH endonuclease [Bacteroidia bacterium]HRH08159.1 HNH endonuclease [Bacteroidia bacterium]
MKYDNEKLSKIYDRTDGCCHICHKKLSFTNYGVHSAKGAWHVEHSIPKAKGGTDHMNNLFAACITCNLEKGTLHTKTARARNGNIRAPFSKEEKESIREDNTIGGAVIGGAIGLMFGPVGALIGSLIGGGIGNSSSPTK